MSQDPCFFLCETREYGQVRVNGHTLRVLSSPGKDLVTQITLVSGTMATVDAIPSNILRLAGMSLEDGPFISVDVVGDEGGVLYLHGDWIALLTKENEDEDFKDPTRVQLVDGTSLLVSESIKTLEARLSGRGFPVIDIDIPSSSRPAVLLPNAAITVAHGNADEVRFGLRGGTEVTVRDPDSAVLDAVLKTRAKPTLGPAAEPEDILDVAPPGFRR